MTEHKIAEEIDRGQGDRFLWYITFVCTCGKRITARGKDKWYATKNAEAKFRDHIPIR